MGYMQLAWGFPPRGKWTYGEVFHPAVVPQSHFNLFSLRSYFLELYVTWIVYYVSVICRVPFRAQLYGLGYPRQPSPRATLAEVTFSLFLSKIQPAVYIRIASSSRGARQLGWASCLTSAGRVTLASGTTFLHINALARLTGTSHGVANVT